LNRIQQGIIAFLFFMNLSFLNAGSWILNDPYPPDESKQKIYYSSFSEQPKTLDPARSYSVDEYLFITQIYEPLLEYDYLLRPYQLTPLTARQMPQVKYLDAQGNTFTDGNQSAPAYSVYIINIKKGVYYQPHPAFAKNQESYLYHHLPASYLDKEGINQLSDFKSNGTRELIVDDYIYQIKRLANPKVSSPIYGLMSEHIVGFKEYGQALPKGTQYVDLRKYYITYPY
jgi:hypothetical protein